MTLYRSVLLNLSHLSCRPRDSLRRIVLSACCTGLVLGLAALSEGAQEPNTASARFSLGWDAAVRLGRWNIATAELPAAAKATVVIECLATDSEGQTAVYQRTYEPDSKSGSLYTVPFQVGRPDAALTVRLTVAGGSPESATFRARTGSSSWTPLVLSDRLVVTVGKPRGFASMTKPVGTPGRSGLQLVELESARDLPTDRAAYDAVDWLVIAGDQAPSPNVLATLQDWVQAGGRLIVSLPANLETWQQSPLRTWMPVQTADQPTVVRELGELERFAGRNLRIPFAGRLEVPKLIAGDGTALAKSADDPLLLRTPWGFGEVVTLTLDLTRPPLAVWGGVDSLMERCLALDTRGLANETVGSQTAIGPLTSNGISDLASQVLAVQDHFTAVQRPAPWFAMAWMLAWLVCIGPLDYLLVHRLLRWPQGTWVTLPLWIGLLGAYAWGTGPAWNREQNRLNQLDVVDVDSSTGYVRAQSWATLYSAETTRFDLAVSPADSSWSSWWGPRVSRPPVTGWYFIPESTTGGLYRPGAAEWGRTEYQVLPDRSALAGLPVLQWSSRTLHTTWGTRGENLIQVQLRNTGLGRLSGEITHHLPGRLEDWMLAYGSRAYRLHPSRSDDSVVPWEAGAKLTTENPLFMHSDLRSVLTQLTITRDESATRVNDQRLIREQAPYDVSGRDPWRLWQMISFHRQAGGKSYTGLTNDWLIDDDCTRQLELGRAVLFGRLVTSPAADVKIVGGSPLVPETSQVFVRIVVPVSRSGEIVRTLPKFGDGEASP